MSRLLDRYDAFAVDLDGVIWRGDEYLPGALELWKAVKERGASILFLTNNAAYEPEYALGRLRQIGIRADRSEFLNTADVAIRWLEKKGLTGASAFVLGDEPVERQMRGALEILPVSRVESPKVVFVARDTRLDYLRLSDASWAVRNGARLVAANRDSSVPVAGGFEPGTGAILAAVEVASGAEAVILGKPNPPMMSLAMAVLGENVLMIGDRADSDVAGAHSIGWDAALVTTGSPPTSGPAPQYVFDSLESLLAA